MLSSQKYQHERSYSIKRGFLDFGFGILDLDLVLLSQLTGLKLPSLLGKRKLMHDVNMKSQKIARYTVTAVNGNLEGLGCW